MHEVAEDTVGEAVIETVNFAYRFVPCGGPLMMTVSVNAADERCSFASGFL